MTHDEILASAREYIKQLFAGEASGHDYYHSLRVERMAAGLAKEEGADVFAVSLAALLHDADDIKLFPLTHENKDNARRFMTSCGIDDAFQNAVCRMTDEISYKGTDSVKPATIEGMCVQDADRLDALGAIGIARTFAYGGSRGRAIYIPDEAPREDMNGEEYRNSTSCSVNHFYEKLLKLSALMNTESAKRAAMRREKLMLDYLDAFMKEWNGEL